MGKYYGVMENPNDPGDSAAAQPQREDYYQVANYSSDQSVGYWIKQAYMTLQRQLDMDMQELDLTGMQWGPLWLIRRCRADTVAACAREAGIDTGAMTRMLDRLEAKGLLERTRSVQDRRVVHVHLTERGRDVADRIPSCVVRVLNRQLRGFGHDEVRQLLDLLQRFVRNGAAAGCADSACGAHSDPPRP